MDNFDTSVPSGNLKRRLSRRQILQAIAVVATATAASACSPTPAAVPPSQATTAPAKPAATTAPQAAGGKIKLGALFPLTGSLALLGEESWRGTEIARQEQNKKGGLLGKELEFLKGDGVDANAAVSEANRLISSEKVPVILGTYSSTLAQAASEVAERNKVIYWEMGGIADAITERGFKYLFRVLPTGSTYGVMGADYAKDVIAPKLGIAPDKLKVAVVHEDALYGTTVGTSAEKSIKEKGLAFAGREPYNSKATDLSPLILKLRAAQPDVLIATSYIQDLLLFWKQARELGFGVKAVLGTGAGYALTDFAKEMGDDVNGVFNIDVTQYEVNPKFAKGLNEFVQMYKDIFKESPRSGHSLIHYMGTQVLFEAIKAANGTEPDAIREAALKIDIKNGETATGYGVKFAAPTEKNAGQNTRAFPLVMQWQNNKQLTVYPKEAAVAEPIIPWAAGVKFQR